MPPARTTPSSCAAAAAVRRTPSASGFLVATRAAGPFDETASDGRRACWDGADRAAGVTVGRGAASAERLLAAAGLAAELADSGRARAPLAGVALFPQGSIHDCWALQSPGAARTTSNAATAAVVDRPKVMARGREDRVVESMRRSPGGRLGGWGGAVGWRRCHRQTRPSPLSGTIRPDHPQLFDRSFRIVMVPTTPNAFAPHL